jgi:signal transduction histidine kinase/streptogramin lyase
LSNDIVSRLLVDHNGTLWAATWDGLNRFDASTGRFKTYSFDSQGGNPFYLELVEDREGTLWLGTHSSGLHRLDPETGQFTIYEHNMNRPETLSDNRVNSVYFDHSGTMWVGTQDGLDSFDSKTGTFTVYTRRDGLPSNSVGCILEDDHGDLWMSTNNGVARFDPRRKTVRKYSTADGLPGPDLTGWGACFKNAAGEMFFGGFSGATAFFPDKVVDSAYAPPIILTNLKLFGTPVALRAGSPLRKSINYTDAITLTHKQQIFSIEFSALSYFNASTNRYRYMLEGLDQQWNEVGSDQRIATYTTLPAGIYTFRVQGATSRGQWSEPGAQLLIEILPPWWGTWWFRTISAALLLVLVFAAYFYRVRQIAKAISARFDERLSERTRMARDLHDAFLQTVQGSKLVADDALDQSADPVRMRRALEQLSVWLGQATQEGRAALNSLRTSTTEKNDLAEALGRATQNGLIPSSMAVAFSVVGDARQLHPIVRDEVYRIGFEAIRNAHMHSGASRLEVELRYGQDLAVRVSDNGIGIDPSVSDKGKDGHFGLQGMRERAARIGGKFTLLSSSTSGTEIKVVVPGGIVFRNASATPFSKIRDLFRRKSQSSKLN